MKRKTDFKQMYLVDDTLYNKISNVTPQLPTSMVVGKLPTTPSLQTTHFYSPTQASKSQPIENDLNLKKEVLEKVPPTVKSSGMMTDNPPTTQPKIMKTSGMMTENIPPTTSQQHQINTLQEQLHNSQLQVRSLEASLQAPQVVHALHHALPDYTPQSRSLQPHTSRLEYQTSQLERRTPRIDNQIPQPDYHSMQLEYRAPRKEDRTMQLEDRAIQLEDRAMQLEDRAMQLEDRTPQMEDRTIQLDPQSPALEMLHSNMIQNVNDQHLTIPQARGPITYYSYPMDTSPEPEQLELMDFNTNQAIEYTTQPNNTLALPPPKVTIQPNNTLALPPPKVTRALPPPVEDECEECSDTSTITKYVKYNEPGIVALPSVQSLPDSVLFTCTLCNTNFNTQRALQRHMKNQHDAFDQKEKGAKRKRVVPTMNSIEMNTKKKSKTDKNLRNKAVVSYSKYL